MGRRKTKEARLEKTRQMYLESKSEEEIAEALQMKLSTVRGYISELGLKRRDWKSIRSGIVAMYAAGKEIKEIMDTWKVNQSYISKVVRNSGLTTRRMRLTEKELIDENTVFADNRVKTERVVIFGKRYLDVTQVVVPR